MRTSGRTPPRDTLPGELLDFTFGDEGVDELLDDGLVPGVHLFDLAELSEEVAVGELGVDDVGVDVDEVAGGCVEGVGELGEGLGGGAGAGLLVAADLRVGEAEALSEGGLGEPESGAEGLDAVGDVREDASRSGLRTGSGGARSER